MVSEDPVTTMEQVLRGVRVIDLTQNVAGPYCTQILGDMGAEVIKIERPQGGDDSRDWRPPAWGDQSSTFLALNRNKQSICIDLDTPQGQEVVRRLARDAHVVHPLAQAGQRRGAWPRLRRPACRQSEARVLRHQRFRPDRADARPAGLRPADAGLHRHHERDRQRGPTPRCGSSVSLIDMGSGMWAAMGILAALREADRTGRGITVETSLLDTGMAWMTVVFVGIQRATGVQPRKIGSAMAIAGAVRAVRRPGRAGLHGRSQRPAVRPDLRRIGRGAHPGGRALRHQPGARAEPRCAAPALEEQTCRLPAAEVQRRLQARGAPCSDMNDVQQMLDQRASRCRGHRAGPADRARRRPQGRGRAVHPGWPAHRIPCRPAGARPAHRVRARCGRLFGRRYRASCKEQGMIG